MDYQNHPKTTAQKPTQESNHNQLAFLKSRLRARYKGQVKKTENLHFLQLYQWFGGAGLGGKNGGKRGKTYIILKRNSLYICYFRVTFDDLEQMFVTLKNGPFLEENLHCIFNLGVDFLMSHSRKTDRTCPLAGRFDHQFHKGEKKKASLFRPLGRGIIIINKFILKVHERVFLSAV